MVLHRASDVQLLRVHHSSLLQGGPTAPASHLALCRTEMDSSQRQRRRSRCCRHPMRIYLALRNTVLKKVQNYHKVTKIPRPNYQ